MDEDMALVCSLSGLSKQQTRALVEARWSVTRFQELDDSFDIDMDVLDDLVRRAGARAENRHLWDAKRGAQELMDAHVAHQRETRRKTFDEVV